MTPFPGDHRVNFRRSPPGRARQSRKTFPSALQPFSTLSSRLMTRNSHSDPNPAATSANPPSGPARAVDPARGAGASGPTSRHTAAIRRGGHLVALLDQMTQKGEPFPYAADRRSSGRAGRHPAPLSLEAGVARPTAARAARTGWAPDLAGRQSRAQRVAASPSPAAPAGPPREPRLRRRTSQRGQAATQAHRSPWAQARARLVPGARRSKRAGCRDQRLGRCSRAMSFSVRLPRARVPWCSATEVTKPYDPSSVRRS
ncbi:hypothetical protein ACWT_3619 [Actinoplanes sp. SE50]|nr:hypothetical protein ACPL_3747 [Actinoplanes sp. SE50/110]ATO83034.1 hypothetical protein ACWT_3619 [Actinoplanes sp. SE50]SLM00442.1 hypothetical protein ACSP50_3674 [Actinoplanes sp. SE50/110]